MARVKKGPKAADPAKKPSGPRVEKKLTEAKVRTAKPSTKPTFLKDGGGLIFRVLPSGAKLAQYGYKLKDASGVWRFASIHLGTYGEAVIDDDGTQHPFGLADARAARDAARLLVAQGRDPRAVRRLERLERAEAERKRLADLEGRRTVRAAFDEWCKHLAVARDKHGKLRRSDGGKYVVDTFNRHVLPTLGDIPLAELRRAQIINLLEGIAASGRRRTANVVLSLVRQFMRWCAKREWIDADPTSVLDRKDAGGEIAPRARNLSTLEIVELRDKLPGALPERGQHIVWALLATGARVGELAGARIDEVDLDAAEWLIPASRSKNGEAHLVHLSDFAMSHVRALIDASKEQATRAEVEAVWLLPSSRNATRPIYGKAITNMIADRQREPGRAGRWKPTKQKVGRKPTKPRAPALVEQAATTQPSPMLVLTNGAWRPHDLRRTMASRMQELAIAPQVIEKCLNHKLEGILAVYQQADLLPERRAAFDAWGAELERLQTASIDNVRVLDTARGRRARAAA